MNVRLAAAADIPAMIELERRCETAAHWSEEQYRAALPGCGKGLVARLMLVAERRPTATTEVSGQPQALAGFLVARDQGPEWELENIIVDQGFRRNGVGTRLLQELFERAKGAGSTMVFLEVRESNQAARRLYEKHGFELTGRRKGYYSGPAENAVLYRRLLGQEAD